MIPSPLRSFANLSPALFLFACSPEPEIHQAQNLSAKPFNQLELSGNACGPTAFLNSSRFGSPEWQRISKTPSGLNDRQRIQSITRGPALLPSASLSGRSRWNSDGINLSDLRDTANEIAKQHNLPAIQQQTLFISPIETQHNHIRRVHKNLARSLSRGFPPILSIRRFVKRNGQWISIEGHFVTITSLPGRIPHHADFFDVTYIDPWGGKQAQGRIVIRKKPFLGNESNQSPNLEAVFPNAMVGKRQVRGSEETILAVSASLTLK